MPFTKKNHVDFEIINDQIKLLPAYLQHHQSKFKKITGSRFSSVLGFNKYTTPLQVWCNMVGIYKETMDPVLAKVGNCIEPKIRDFVSKKLDLDFKVYNPAQVNWDVFIGDHDVYGGVPDGEPIDANGNLNYPEKPMLEIKTTSIDSFVYKQVDGETRLIFDAKGLPLVKKNGGKKATWFDDNQKIVIPPDYKLQLGLYLYLRNIEKGLFAICFLKGIDYKEPEKINLNQREVHLVNMNMNRNQILPFIETGINWYNTYIKQGISPKFTDIDHVWLQEQLKAGI